LLRSIYDNIIYPLNYVFAAPFVARFRIGYSLVETERPSFVHPFIKRRSCNNNLVPREHANFLYVASLSSASDEVRWPEARTKRPRTARMAMKIRFATLLFIYCGKYGHQVLL
jgi:hypothetical protein